MSPGVHMCNAAGQKIDAQGDVIPKPFAATENDKAIQRRMIVEWIRPRQLYDNMRVIQPPAIQAVDINSAYFSYVGQRPFHGLLPENPLDHIETLEDFVFTIQRHEGTKDYILYKLFKYSLSQNAVNWLKLLPPESLTTWNDVKTTFLTKLFDDARVEEMRNKIWTFSQRPLETFRSYWDTFRSYQKDCPHHGFTEVQLLRIFF